MNSDYDIRVNDEADQHAQMMQDQRNKDKEDKERNNERD